MGGLLWSLLRRQPPAGHEPVFSNRYGRPLGASGVRHKLALYVTEATKAAPSLRKKRVTPHSFRHAAAPLEAGAGIDSVAGVAIGKLGLPEGGRVRGCFSLDTLRLSVSKG